MHNIDIAEPYPASFGGPRYVVMFVDSTSRLQRPYGIGEKSAFAILAVVKHFVANIGIPLTFRTDHSTEYLNGLFVDFCHNFVICREFTVPNTPQHNEPVESAISRAFKARHETHLGVRQLYPNVPLEEIWGCNDAEGTSLWLEALLWASECFNQVATSIIDEGLSSHEVFYGSFPLLSLLPFF